MQTAPLYATKSDFAYRTLRERILTGELTPGQVLNQATLARTIGISTTPLREALRRLTSEGLVELDAHRDARVADVSADEARDLVELRRALDPLAAALAAERRTPDDVAAIRAAAADLEPLRPDSGADHLAAHRRFHAAVHRASHNALLITTLDGLQDRADRYRHLGLATDGGVRDPTAEHARLVECVVAGDAEGAAEVMRTHVDTSLGARAARQMRGPSRAR